MLILKHNKTHRNNGYIYSFLIRLSDVSFKCYLGKVLKPRVRLHMTLSDRRTQHQLSLFSVNQNAESLETRSSLEVVSTLIYFLQVDLLSLLCRCIPYTGRNEEEACKLTGDGYFRCARVQRRAPLGKVTHRWNSKQNSDTN